MLFRSPVDLDILTNLQVFSLKIFKTGALGKFTKEIVMPQEDVTKEVLEEGKLEKLREYLRDKCSPVFHPVGTAALLPREDGGVVDPQLRVYGTLNLRVVCGFHYCSLLNEGNVLTCHLLFSAMV